MIINNNLSAMNAHRQLGVNQNNMQSSMEKLSSGEQINRAGDDAAGLAISEKMRAQIRGLDQASSNAQDGISLIQTAEGALDETHQILQRMRELAVQSANDTNQDDVDREAIQAEVDALAEEIDRISDNTTFNDQQLLNGDFEDESLTFLIGANSDENIEVNIDLMSAEALGVAGDGEGSEAITGSIAESEVEDGVETSVFTSAEGDTTAYLAEDGSWYSEVEVEDGDVVAADGASTVNVEVDEDDPEQGTIPASSGDGIDVSNQSAADAAIDQINEAINDVSTQRSDLGAVQNRLEHTISNLDNASENLQAAESRIRDTDMAQEMMEFTQSNILSQASQSMLAQANQLPQNVLQLLQ
ncbi:flagellin [Salicibibacter cibarius]|uniref:Flagellin n=1 Tax=Salicibibacter cibarius TaxID=2743000 RepID=A0A7T6Z1L1_9BACI|nr:flagellin [Salicibibacter cibarius]QQK75202.1 flagellin [Salicibibacter cibarius]